MRSMIKCEKKLIKHSYYISLYVLIIACGSNTDSYTKNNSQNLYDNEIHNPKISIYQDKDLAVSSSSNKLIKDDGKDAVLVGNVVSNFFNEEGAHITTLYSDSAIVENISNNLKAFGNVTVVSDSGYTLKSNQILWNNQYKLITSEDSILLTDESGNDIRGVGFQSDMDLTNYKIFKFIGSFKEVN
jgi:LPS export ABC transporter protein LptC